MATGRPGQAHTALVSSSSSSLAPELWTLILIGDGDVDKPNGVEPKWRFAARAVCRTWRAIVDRGAPSFYGHGSRARQVALCKHERQVLWGRGRLVCASAFVEWAEAGRDGIVRDGAAVEGLVAWINGASPVSEHDVMVVLAASGVPALVERALTSIRGGRAVPHGTQILGKDVDIVSPVPRNAPWPRMSRHEAAAHRPFVVAAAIVRSGCRRGMAHIAADMPRALMGHLAVQAAAANDDPVAVQTILAIGGASHGEALAAMEWAAGPRVVAWCLKAAGEPRDRAWAVNLAAWLASTENRRDLVTRCIERTVHATAAILGVYDKYGITDAIATDDACRLICRRRSIGGARWILGRAEHQGGMREWSRVLKRLAEGACCLYTDTDCDGARRCSDVLLSWLCDGPPRYHPLVEGITYSRLDPILSAAGKVAGLVDPGRFAWLCERWPEEAGRMHPSWAAYAMRAACDWAKDDHDIGTVERMVALLDTMAARAAEPAALVQVVDVWSFFFERLEHAYTSLGIGAYVAAAALIQHAWWRCQDDMDAHTAGRLAEERAMVLCTIDPEARRPWRCVGRCRHVAALVPRASDARHLARRSVSHVRAAAVGVARRAQSFASGINKKKEFKSRWTALGPTAKCAKPGPNMDGKSNSSMSGLHAAQDMPAP